MQPSLASRNPLVLLWLPFIVAVIVFISQELPAAATSIAAARDADGPIGRALYAELADDLESEVSRSVGLMTGAQGDQPNLGLGESQVEVSRSVGLMTGAIDDAADANLAGRWREAEVTSIRIGVTA
jgi:hypothetical protein